MSRTPTYPSNTMDKSTAQWQAGYAAATLSLTNGITWIDFVSQSKAAYGGLGGTWMAGAKACYMGDDTSTAGDSGTSSGKIPKSAAKQRGSAKPNPFAQAASGGYDSDETSTSYASTISDRSRTPHQRNRSQVPPPPARPPSVGPRNQRTPQRPPSRSSSRSSISSEPARYGRGGPAFRSATPRPYGGWSGNEDPQGVIFRYPTPAVDAMRMRMRQVQEEAQEDYYEEPQQAQQGYYEEPQQAQQGYYEPTERPEREMGDPGPPARAASPSRYTDGGSAYAGGSRASHPASFRNPSTSRLLQANQGGVNRRGQYVDTYGTIHPVNGTTAQAAAHVMRGPIPPRESRRR